MSPALIKFALARVIKFFVKRKVKRMFKGKLTATSIAALAAFALSKVLGVDIGVDEISPLVEAGVVIATAAVGFYGRWRATRG